MANQKNYYYVLVFTDKGPVYVTGCNNSNNWATWDKNGAPKDFPKYYAEEIVLGLNCNYYHAVLVCAKSPIEYQPYNYTHYNCTFELKS